MQEEAVESFFLHFYEYSLTDSGICPGTSYLPFTPVRRMEIRVLFFRESRFRQKRNHFSLKPYNVVMHF